MFKIYKNSCTTEKMARDKGRPRFAKRGLPYQCEQVCKPGSVLNGHLSRRIVAGALQPPRERTGRPIAPIAVLLRIEFTASDTLEPMGELLPRLSTLTSEEAVYLCCTFPEVAFGGRYPLSLPCGARTFLMDRLLPYPRDRLAYSHCYCTGPGEESQPKSIINLAKGIELGGKMRYTLTGYRREASGDADFLF